MPKKVKRKRKSKSVTQSQSQNVVIRLGEKPPVRRARRAPAARPPSSISVILQGSTMSLPPPPTQDYNLFAQQMEYFRRQDAQSGSLIPRMATNDLLNRVTETNPFQMKSTNTQANMLDPYEGLMEEQVEASTNIDGYADGNYTLNVPIDQDFIRQKRLSNIAPTLGGTIRNIAEYDDGDLEDKLAEEVVTSTKKGRPKLVLTEKEMLQRKFIKSEKAKEARAKKKIMEQLKQAYGR